MHPIRGVVQHYPWGSTRDIPVLLGIEPDGREWAEYWLGTHPSGEAQLANGPLTLAQWVAAQPQVLGEETQKAFGAQLPFLLKVLSAGKPLSLQAHPSRKQAQEGYAAEDAAGIAIDSPTRTFRDSWPKPETIVALSPFDALVGFRDPRATAGLFAALNVKSSLDSIIGPLTERSGPAALAEVFLDVLSVGEDRRHLVDEVVAAAFHVIANPGPLGEFARTAVELDEHFPGDPGILAALLMNRVRLEPGQALHLPPGHMHAYLKGTAIEVQANSDNVLRGGLTKKHINVDGLISVVVFEPEVVTPIEPDGDEGRYHYPASAPEFDLWMLQPVAADRPLDVPATDRGRIAFVTEGQFTMSGTEGEQLLAKGQALFIHAGDTVSATGTGQLFLAASGL